MDEKLRTLLTEYHKEEMADHKKYCDLAEELKGTCPTVAGVMKDIAREEGTHAHLIEHLLENY